MRIRGVPSTNVDIVRGLSRQPLPTMSALRTGNAGICKE
jgi:hypothetical protein